MRFLLVLTLLLVHLLSSTFSKDDEELIGCSGIVKEDITTSARFDEIIFHDLATIRIPRRFDSRNKWSFCKSLFTVLYQGHCGGCWAFSSVSVMSDRFCIATNGLFNEFLSIQDVLECCTDCIHPKDKINRGCRGGSTREAFEFWEESKVVTAYCKPLDKTTLQGKLVKKCRTKCTNASMANLYDRDKKQGKVVYHLVKPSVVGLNYVKAELMLKGPVVGSINIYDYVVNVTTKKVLKMDPAQSNETLGRHAIKIIGWDKIGQDPVWIVANSWGRKWCGDGYCYIRRGRNDFNIEGYEIMTGEAREFEQIDDRLRKLRSGTSSPEKYSIIIITGVLSVKLYYRPIQ